MLLIILPLNPINALVFLLYKHDAQVVSQTVHLTKNTKRNFALKKQKRNKSKTNKATKTTTRKTMHNKNKAK